MNNVFWPKLLLQHFYTANLVVQSRSSEKKKKKPFMASIFHSGHLQPFYEIIVMRNFTGVNSNLKGRSTSTWILPSLQILEPRKAFFLLVTPRYMQVQSQGLRLCTYTHWLPIDKRSQYPKFLHLLQYGISSTSLMRRV